MRAFLFRVVLATATCLAAIFGTGSAAAFADSGQITVNHCALVQLPADCGASPSELTFNVPDSTAPLLSGYCSVPEADFSADYGFLNLSVKVTGYGYILCDHSSSIMGIACF